MKKRKLIVFGLVSLLSFVSFGYCSDIIYLQEVYSTTVQGNFWRTYYNFNENHQYDLVCYRNISSCSRNDMWWSFSSASDDGGFSNSNDDGNGGGGLGSCTTDGPSWLSFNPSCLLEVKAYIFSGFSQESCESEFDLISPESCPVYNLSLAPLGGNTENYSITGNVNVVVNDGIDYELDNQNNALWLSVGLNTEIGGQCSGSVGSGTNWSALYINDIQHESAPLINITIPEEFERDYTNNNDVFNLWVSGYNVDTAYIDGIITTQKTLPDKQDFNDTISGLLPLFVPGLVIIACLYFIFRFIKKVF